MAANDLKYLLAPDGVTDDRFLRARESFWEYCKLRNPKFSVMTVLTCATWQTICKHCTRAD